jgi:hypothetical protein
LNYFFEDDHIAVDEFIGGIWIVFIHVLGLKSENEAVLLLLSLLTVEDLVSSVHLQLTELHSVREAKVLGHEPPLACISIVN